MLSRLLSRLFLVAAVVACTLTTAVAQSARLSVDGAQITMDGPYLDLTVGLDRPIPWTVDVADGQFSLVLEGFRWTELPAGGDVDVFHLRVGAIGLAGVDAVESAEMRTLADGTAVLGVQLKMAPDQKVTPPRPKARHDRVVIVLDPGHGGVDPGAAVGGLAEAPLVLGFARRLKEHLLRTMPDVSVVLTREDDSFVGLDTRVRIARRAGADVMISLHADALKQGQAAGLSVYTLRPTETADASSRLIANSDGRNILAGVNLDGVGDDVATVLMDLARTNTGPQADRLSKNLIAAFRNQGLPVNSRPARHGNFAVLGAADYPSVLVELGFLSTPEDRVRLTSAEWQDQAVGAMVQAIRDWIDETNVR